MKQAITILMSAAAGCLICMAVTDKPYIRDYQMDIHKDTLWLYSGHHFVGMSIGKTYQIDSLIMKDNQ